MKNGIFNMGHVSSKQATALQHDFIMQYKANVHERISALLEMGAKKVSFNSTEELLHNDMIMLYESEVERDELVRAIHKLNSTPVLLTQALQSIEQSAVELRHNLRELLRGKHGAEA